MSSFGLSCLLLLLASFFYSAGAFAQQFNLESDTWELLSLPADIEELPVETIFENALNPVDYNATWILFTFNALEQTYQQLELTDTIASGDAFWIRQNTGEPVVLNIPAGLAEPEGGNGQGCVADQGCFEKPLSNQDVGLGDFGFNMIGSPFNRDTPFDELRIIGGSPTGDCFEGCSFEEAASLGVVAGFVFTYNSATGVYDMVTDGDQLSVWQGFWTGPLVDSDIENPALLFPASADEGNPCDGVAGATDACPFPTVEVNTSPFQLTMVVGQQINTSTTVDFSTVRSESYTVSVVQALSNGGISVTPGVQPGFTTNSDRTTVDNQIITATAEGVYEIVTTATIIELDESASSTISINVVSSESNLAVQAPGFIPAVIDGTQFNQVTVTGLVTSNAPGSAPLVVSLGGGLTGSLSDDGIGADLAEADSAYTGTVDIAAGTLVNGECVDVFITASQSGETSSSESVQLCASEIAGIPSPPNFSLAVTDPSNDISVITNEILISFVDGTTDDQKLSVTGGVGGEIVGSIPQLNIVQVRLPGSSTAAELSNILDEVGSQSIVEFVELVGIAQTQSVTPSDTLFASQGALPQMRAGEAWTIARGSVTIAVIDTGIDSDHSDLDGKIVGGRNFIVPGTFPEDDNGHGSHVAGIAAAETNNGAGIAGTSWGSKVLPVKSCNAAGGCSATDIAAGISFAADSGARVINVSLRKKGNGWFGLTGGSNEKTICKAVDYAHGKGSIVVAAAGNDSSSARVFPGACDNAYAVGNVTSSDQRSPMSNFGSWVDIAAPGVGILSTVPGGGYGLKTGTSMSSPYVAGAIAVLLSRENLTNSEIRDRFGRTAVPLASSANLGAGRIDLFEAVFNGSFEEGNLALWDVQGTASSKISLGAIVPQDRSRMGSVSTGPADTQVSGTMEQSFEIQEGITSFPLSFKYAFVTEEYPEFVGSTFNDSLRVTLITPSGQERLLAEESVNESSFIAISGIDFPGGDETVGWTGWQSVSINVLVTAGAGTYRISLSDAGDAIFDTETLIDDIKFVSTATGEEVFR